MKPPFVKRNLDQMFFFTDNRGAYLQETKKLQLYHTPFCFDRRTNSFNLELLKKKAEKLMNKKTIDIILLAEDPEGISFEFLEDFFRLFKESLDLSQFDHEFPFVLVNTDMNDIFVSWEDPGRVVAILDWECLVALPL